MTRRHDDRSERGTDEWDVEIRSHRTPYFACAAAAIIVAVHIVLGLLLNVRSTGVYFQTADQIAIGLLGVIVGAVVLLLVRPRLRVGPPGVSVRNLFGDKLIPWSDVVGVSFHPGARWARVDLPDDEYVPAMAIQVIDKERAVAAMDRVRELIDKYQTQGNPRR